ncbi:MAG: hypothetical protein ACXVCO_18905 [Ktedonobacterales bacterium]
MERGCGKLVGKTMRETGQASRITREISLVRNARRWLVALVVMGTLLLLTACDSGSSGQVSTDSTASPGSANATTTAGGTPTATAADTATPTPISGPGAQFGSSQYCSEKPNVSVQLPPSIPAYPNAELRLSQAAGDNSIYGLCTTADVAAAIQFYADQLPGKGWQQLQRNNNDPVEQITAKRSGYNVTITAYPDAKISNETDIIIQLSAA